MTIGPFALTQCKTLLDDEFKRLPKVNYAMEPKIDGWRIQADIDSDGVCLWTRTNHIATGKVPEAESKLQRAGDMRLDGEMVYLDLEGRPDYNWTARCLGSGVEVCVDKQYEANKHLTYVVFDILRLGDQDLRRRPYMERRKLLEEMPESDYVKIIPIAEPTLGQHLENLDRYEEGSVLKDLSAAYAGRRHKSWLKWKYQPTVDAKIIGFKMANPGKFAGLIGAVHFRSQEGVEGFCSGMDDETRVQLTNHREELIGTWIEIKHFGLLVDGYRHPQFLRFRPDK